MFLTYMLKKLHEKKKDSLKYNTSSFMDISFKEDTIQWN